MALHVKLPEPPLLSVLFSFPRSELVPRGSLHPQSKPALLQATLRVQKQGFGTGALDF